MAAFSWILGIIHGNLAHDLWRIGMCGEFRWITADAKGKTSARSPGWIFGTNMTVAGLVPTMMRFEMFG